MRRQVRYPDRQTEKVRITSIDWWKGHAIAWVCFIHLATTLLILSNQWFWQFMLLFLDVLGPTTFLFFAGANATLSYNMNREKGLSFLTFYYQSCRKMCGLLIVSTIYNLFFQILSPEPGTTTVWSWFFRWEPLQAIAIGTIVIIPLLKTSKWFRLLLAVLIFLFYYPLFVIVASNSSVINTLLNLIFFFPFDRCPILPFFGETLIGSVFMELMLAHRKNELHFKQFILTMFLIGIALLLFSIGFGWQMSSVSTFDSQTIGVVSTFVYNPVLHESNAISSRFFTTNSSDQYAI